MPELVLYGITLLAKQFLGTFLDIEVDQSALQWSSLASLAGARHSNWFSLPRVSCLLGERTASVQNRDNPNWREEIPPQAAMKSFSPVSMESVSEEIIFVKDQTR